jgi:ParB family chromosome partitioning protein
LLPVRSLHFWIESNILLIPKLAPFDKRDAQACSGSGELCGLPQADWTQQASVSGPGQAGRIDPTCYQGKVDAPVAKTLAAKPKLVQISTAYGQQEEGSATSPRNMYVEVRPDKPTSKEEGTRPEFKTCKFTTETIVWEGIDKGEIRKVCTEPTCPVHLSADKKDSSPIMKSHRG